MWIDQNVVEDSAKPFSQTSEITTYMRVIDGVNGYNYSSPVDGLGTSKFNIHEIWPTTLTIRAQVERVWFGSRPQSRRVQGFFKQLHMSSSVYGFTLFEHFNLPGAGGKPTQRLLFCKAPTTFQWIGLREHLHVYTFSRSGTTSYTSTRALKLPLKLEVPV